MANSTTFDRKGKKIVMIPTPTGGLAPINSSAPVAVGTVAVGNTLSCTSGTWISQASVTYSYQWQRNGSDIPGAVFTTYTCVNADLSTVITCMVTAANRYGVAYFRSNQLTGITNNPTIVYDTSMGNAVDSNGFTSLPLNAGGKYIFVNTSIGNDSNTITQAQNPATPVATIAKAITYVTAGSGDQILLAEGQTFSEVMANFTGKSGASPLYPTCVRSYDPADPTNTAKYGRGDQRGARPKVTGGGQLCGGSASGIVNYIAIQGIDFDTGVSASGQTINIFRNGTDPLNYWLFENNIVRHTQVNFDEIGPNGAIWDTITESTHLIIRNSSIYGAWSSTDDHFGQGIFIDGWDSGTVTVEDCVLYHAGWKIGALRTDTLANGGTGGSLFRHNIYFQSTNRGTNQMTYRRNLSMDGCSDGGQFRAYHAITDCLFIDNPTNAALGGGTNYSTYQPLGVLSTFTSNAVLGGADIDSPTGQPRFIGIETENCKVGSQVYSNLFARSNGIGGANTTALKISAPSNQPSTADFYNNVVYQWASSGSDFFVDVAGFPAQCFLTKESNYLDDPASGSNLTLGSLSAPNPYTAAQLYAALTPTYPSITDKASFATYVINHPEAHVQRTAKALLFAGYNVPTSPATLALRSTSFTVGTPQTVDVLGVHPGTTLALVGAPASFTINSSARTVTYDGTGSPSTPTFTITEDGVSSSISVTLANVTAKFTTDVASATPTNNGTTITISGAGGGPFGARANRGISSGKVYWEAVSNAENWDICYGVANSTASLTASFWSGTANVNAAGWMLTTLRYNTTSSSVTSTTVGATHMFALDMTAGKLWIGKNGTWINGNPTAGTGGLSLTGLTGPVYAAFQGGNGDQATFNFGATAYTYTPPTGFGNF